MAKLRKFAAGTLLFGAAAVACTSDSGPIEPQLGTVSLGLDPCRDVDLIASVSYDPSQSWFDATRTFSPPLSYVVPTSINVTQGAPGYGYATLAASIGQQQSWTCYYFSQDPAGGAYYFGQCSNGAQPGATLVADTITLHVADGDHAAGPTKTKLHLDESSQCLPLGSLNPPYLDQSVPTDFASYVSFLHSGQNPIQYNVAANAIDPLAVSVIRGRVVDGNGAPLPQVTISVKDHPELGMTFTRSDGFFDIAVNGGRLNVVEIQYGGMLIQRTADTPVHKWIHFWDHLAYPLDLPSSTSVDLTTSSVKDAVHHTNWDADGDRKVRLVFLPGTHAWQGTTELTSPVTVKISEYTYGPLGKESMPGDLPKNVAYTYAADFAVDGIDPHNRIDFKTAGGAPKDVFVYLERPSTTETFLGVVVGTEVPMGYYDFTKSAWVASANGCVVQVADGSGNLSGGGGSGACAAAVLAAIDPAEKSYIASKYAVGKKLWRIPIQHFTPWDANWGVSPPSDATPPPGTPPPPPRNPDPCKTSGSIIECQNQMLGEKVPLAGTPFNLHYVSDRAAGYAHENKMVVPVTGSTAPPASMKRIDVRVTVAGKEIFNKPIPRPLSGWSSGMTETVTWDGTGMGGKWNGSATADVYVSYAYSPYYGKVPKFGYDGGGVRIAGDKLVRDELRLLSGYTFPLGHFDSKPMGLGGWQVDAQHVYDPSSHILYKGNGVRLSADTLDRWTTSSVCSGCLNGGMALGFRDPVAPVAPKDGRIYFSYSSTIYGVNSDGTWSVYRTLGANVYSLAFDGSGNLYARSGYQILRVPASGATTVIAGTGVAPTSDGDGDGGLATAAKIYADGGIAVAPDGAVYIADQYRLRRISTDGYITSVAGGSTCTLFSATPYPATSACVHPRSVALGPDGGIYFSEGNGPGEDFTNSNRVRRVGIDGQITTIAGICSPTGCDSPAYDGDGGAARLAHLNRPSGLAIAPDGSIYVSETEPLRPGRIRRIGPDGIIRTIAGGVYGGSLGDGGPAVNAWIQNPAVLALQLEDAAVISVLASEPVGRIRRIYNSLPTSKGGDITVPDPTGSLVYVFDSKGRHLRTRHGLTGADIYQFYYDTSPDRRLSSVVQYAPGVLPSGTLTTTINYGAAPEPKITSPFSQDTQWHVGIDGYVAWFKNPNAEQYNFTYSNGLLLTFQDPRGNTHTMDYDPSGSGLLKKDSAPLSAGASKTLTRTALTGAVGWTTDITSAGGKTTSYKTEAKPDGSYGYTTTLPTLKSISATLGTDGRLTTVLPDGTTSHTTQIRKRLADPRFAMASPVISQVDTMLSGLTRTVDVTKSTTPATLSDPFGFTAYQEERKLNVGAGSPFEGATVLAFNPATKVFTFTSAEGRIDRFTIDGVGRVTRREPPGVAAIDYFFHTASGKVDHFTQGSRTTTFGYGSGYVTSIMDALGRTTTIVRDSVGRVTGITSPLIPSTTAYFSYDKNGNLETVTPAGRPAHGLAYTSIDKNSSYTPPAPDAGTDGGGYDGGTTSWSTSYHYDADNHLDYITRPDGSTINFEYTVDTAGRLTKTTHTGTSVSVGYEYDDTATPPGLGQLWKLKTPAVSPTLTVTHTYDGWLPTTISWSGDVVATYALTYDHPLGAFPSRFLPASDSVTMGGNTLTASYDYDRDNRLKSAAGITLTPLDSAGRRTLSSIGTITDAIVHNSTYGEVDAYDAKIGGVSAFAQTLNTGLHPRDLLGRIIYLDETIPAVSAIGAPAVTSSYVYSYDNAGRLLSATLGGSAWHSYTYDSNGNRLTRTAAGTTITYTYDSQDRLQSSNDGKSYDYTSNGELWHKYDGSSTTTYSYDALGNLKSVALPSGSTVTYVVDGANRRVAVKVGGATTRTFIYDTQSRLIAESITASGVFRRYVYIEGNTPALAIQYDSAGNKTYRIFSDHLGSPRVVVDVASATVVQRSDYDDFGYVSGEWSASGWDLLPFGFAGGLYDRDTKLVRFGARDFDAASGRWTSKDPVRFGGGDPNLYAYVVNDPVNLTDPEGTNPWAIGVAVWVAFLEPLGDAPPLLPVGVSFPPPPDPTPPPAPAGSGFGMCTEDPDKPKKDCVGECLPYLGKGRRYVGNDGWTYTNDLGGDWAFWRCLDECEGRK